MRDELERMIAMHGVPWIVALVAVAVVKMFSKERQTVITIIRSLMAALLIAFLVVENQAGMSRGELFLAVALTAALSDFIVEAVLLLGVKIKQDPTIITRFFGGRK